HPYFNPVRDDLNKKYKYENIPKMVCGDARIKDDLPPAQAVYGGEITGNMIEILFEWLNEVVTEYNLSAQTLFYARNLLDKYIAVNSSSTSYLKSSPVPRNKLQLLGITVLMVASKIFEIFPPGIKDFVYITNNTFTVNQLEEMEIDIVTK